MTTTEQLLRGLDASLAHKGQQEVWEADMKAFEGIRDDDEDELRRVRGEAYQVAGFYAMFQGVIFTAASQPNLLNCSLSWWPIFLSLAVSLATILAIADKLYSIGELQEDIRQSKLAIGAIQGALDSIDNQGAGLDLQSSQPRQEIPRKKRAGFRCLFGSANGLVALVFPLLFSIHVSIFSYKVLCRRPCLHCSP